MSKMSKNVKNVLNLIIFQYFLASRLSGLNEIPPVQLNAHQLTGYQKNEFDTSKFTSGLVYRNHSNYDLPSFGLDPDEPIFVTGPYGPGGLKRQDYYQRPYSALSGSNRAAPSYGKPERPDSSLQVCKFRRVVVSVGSTGSWHTEVYALKIFQIKHFY